VNLILTAGVAQGIVEVAAAMVLLLFARPMAMVRRDTAAQSGLSGAVGWDLRIGRNFKAC
jgi:hypothetical protein